MINANLKTILISGVVYFLLMLGVIHFVPQITSKQTGALVGPDIPFKYIRVGGVLEWFGHQDTRTSTTTICALQGPAATSTLEFASVKLDTASTSASIITIAKASTAFATTTIIGSQYAIAASAKAYITASTTPGVNGTATQFAPSEWLVVGMQGGAGTMSPDGACNARWVSAD